jgi:hypothetical protein
MTYPVDPEGLPEGVPASDVFHGGLVDYNDTATTTTPLSVTGGGADVQLTNDTLGAFTNTAFLPLGITSLWNVGTNQFDFTQLKLGDMLDIRLELTADMLGPNSELEIDLELGIGGSPYTISYSRESYKTSGVKQIDRWNGIYLGDNNTLNNPARFIVRSDTNCDITVAGWYVKIIRKG